MKPYTYHIGWKDLDIHYYGVRYAQDCDPSDLWNPYKTSSQYVADFVEIHGTPDIIQVRQTFESSVDPVMSARFWEIRVLKRLRAVEKDNWLNKHDSMSPPINPLGNLAMRRPELRERASENNSGSKNPMFGRKQKRKVCEHCKEDVAANVYPTYHGDNCEVISPDAKNKAKLRNGGVNNAMYGKKQSKVSCLVCHKIVDVANFARSHGNKCRDNLTNLVVNTDRAVLK